MPDTHVFRQPADGSRKPAGEEPASIELTREPVEVADATPEGEGWTAAGSGHGGGGGPVPRQRPGGSPSGPRPSRRRAVVLGSALALGLAGAAVFGSAGLRLVQQKDATLATPSRVAGLSLDDSERAHGAADYLRTGLAAGISLDKSVGAVYADPEDAERSVLLFGGTTLIWRPERDLDRLFRLVSDDADVTGLREVPAGDLGGIMKCGTTSTPEGDLAVCGWADHGSVALAMFPGRGVDESAELMRDIRDEIQSRD